MEEWLHNHETAGPRELKLDTTNLIGPNKLSYQAELAKQHYWKA